jgi:hypothetical protein
VAEREVSLSWVDGSGTGVERSRVTFTDYSCSVDGRIDGPAHDPFVLEYAVSCDEDWRTRYVFAAEAGGGQRLELLASGRGHWTDGDGEPLPGLRGVLDVDISVTPFTNTLAIRRLDLRLGESAETTVAFVSAPELAVGTDRQRYTRLGPRTYLFESLDAGFEREITVDADGLVLDYPGLFSRVG